MKALQDRWTILHHDDPEKRTSLKGLTPESWLCVDCGFNTAPGCLNRKEKELVFNFQESIEENVNSNSEIYQVTADVWKLTGLEDWGGCLCIGCLEKRIGRRLKPNDFDPNHPFSSLPGTRRLLKRRGKRRELSQLRLQLGPPPK